MLFLKKKTTLALDLSSNIILIIRLINILLANIGKIFLITNIDYIFLKISLIINLIFSLSLLLILI